MTPDPLASQEARRLRCLSDLEIDTPKTEPLLDGLVQLAATACGCPIALVSLLDDRRQWFKARHGLAASETPREHAFCHHAIEGEGLFEVPDARADGRYAANPLVTGAPHIVFYAGVPIGRDGQKLGTLCVIDTVPRRLDAQQRALLEGLARTVSHWLEGRHEQLLVRRVSDAKAMLVARLSHELRTPLNAILGYTQLMESDRAEPLGPVQRDRAAQVRHAGEHLLGLIGDALDMARHEQGQRRLVPASLPLDAALDAGVAMVEAMARDKRVRIERSGTPHLAVRADARALEQVLLNLLSNAIKYNRPGGRLAIDVALDGDEVAVCVSDEGAGLNAEQLGGLFQPFNRLGAEQGAVPGSGLGLFISKSLVEAMGGRLDASSTPGRGSRFCMRLPCAPEPASVAAAAAAAAGAARSATILYIEDEPVNALLVTEALRTMPQWTLVTAGDGEAGLALARALRPDLVLSDINLPGLDGEQVVRALRVDATTRAMPCVAVSANAMPEQVARARQAGFDDYWVKPLDLAQLITRVGRLLVAEPLAAA